MAIRPRRVTIIASEILGRPGTGGAGTADSLLALALAQSGHSVRLGVARAGGEVTPEWKERYDDAGVSLTFAEQLLQVEPAFLRPTIAVGEMLRRDPPEVAIVNDWRGLGYAPMRLRELGRAFET